jgi:bifunctional non-homologous end joining protein LigD
VPSRYSVLFRSLRSVGLGVGLGDLLTASPPLAFHCIDRSHLGPLSRLQTMSLPSRALPAGFIAPCLPTSAPQPPSGASWLHEIKHDGFRIIARKDGKRVRLYSRPGNDLTKRFPLIVDGLAALRTRSCIIDGEAVACGEDGIASFDRIRYRRHDRSVFLYAFDLIELDGEDLRREPLAVRKATLASVLARPAAGLRFNEHLEGEDGPLVFRHACKLGLEGIVSKLKDSQYRSGRSPHWIKSKNPDALAVKREAEEDWGR